MSRLTGTIRKQNAGERKRYQLMHQSHKVSIRNSEEPISTEDVVVVDGETRKVGTKIAA